MISILSDRPSTPSCVLDQAHGPSLGSPRTPALGLDLAHGSSLTSLILLSDDDSLDTSSPVCFPSPKEIVDDLQSFNEMIEDMAVKYWVCLNCLGMGHMSDTCTNRIRCRLCFRSGHVKKDYPSINAGSTVWVPKVPSPGFEPRALTEPLPDASGSLPSPSTSTSPSQNQSAQKPQSTPPPPPTAADSPPMAVYEHDPH